MIGACGMAWWTAGLACLGAVLVAGVYYLVLDAWVAARERRRRGE